MEFKNPLHVGTPNIGDTGLFYKYTDRMFDNCWLTNHGELVIQFEKELQDHLGVKHCIAMCNGTSALEIAIRALGLTGEVIIPSLTFVATAHALQWHGVTPVFCDVDPDTLCIDPAEIERHITPRTTGILAVHVFGHCCDTGALQDLADSRGLKLLFDAAHAFGNMHNGTKIGNFGECEVFSFHATKFFNSFEGGAIATNNDELAEKIRLMQNFGFEDWDTVTHLGTNGKMTEVCAAMGLTNLRGMDRFRDANRRNYEAYAEGLRDLQGLRLIRCDAGEDMADKYRFNKHYVVVEVTKEFPLTRDDLLQRLHNENVLARRYFWPGCHRMEPYRSLQPDAGQYLSTTESILERILLFPTGVAINPSIIRRILARIADWTG